MSESTFSFECYECGAPLKATITGEIVRVKTCKCCRDDAIDRAIEECKKPGFLPAQE
jgi:hypothetical protein